MATTVDYSARTSVTPAANADLNPNTDAAYTITFSSKEIGDVNGVNGAGEIGDLVLDNPDNGLAFDPDPDTWVKVDGVWHTFDVKFFGLVDHNNPDLYDFTDTGGPNFNITTLVQIELDDGSLLFFFPEGSFDLATMDLFPNGGVPMDYTGIDPNEPPAICFVNGTHIATGNSEVAVEDFNVGDIVMTSDNGSQTISWIGKRSMPGNTPAHLMPIRIKASALGAGLPKRDLLVSPQHRILVNDWRAELLFGEPEVLVAAKHLVNDDTIRVAADLEEFEYFHILFDSHQTIYSEGLPTESFHPGDMAMNSLSEASRNEILELFPELADGVENYGPAAHPSLKSFEAKALQRA